MKIWLLVLVIALSSDGCSHFTAAGRSQAAYARYVRRCSKGRVKLQQKMAKTPHLPKADAQGDEPRMATRSGPESESGPQSVTSSSPEQSAPIEQPGAQ
ncbi:MAG: hypothetical protein M3R59_09970 [Verrucomicrobiota bacterium]|nr:hypothetical protein [Verrucomicrobiota bacterium]